MMVHDLTATMDFSNRNNRERFFGVARRLQELQDEINTYEMEQDLVLTGDCNERNNKRFYIDYLTDSMLCDCCGCVIDKIPWRLQEKDCKLCVSCEKRLQIECDKKYRSDILGNEVVERRTYKIIKPWTILPETESRGTINDIFLWD